MGMITTVDATGYVHMRTFFSNYSSSSETNLIYSCLMLNVRFLLKPMFQSTFFGFSPNCDLIIQYSPVSAMLHSITSNRSGKNNSEIDSRLT